MQILNKDHRDSFSYLVAASKPTLTNPEVTLSDDPLSPSFSVFACNNSNPADVAKKLNTLGKESIRQSIATPNNNRNYNYNEIPSLDLGPSTLGQSCKISAGSTLQQKTLHILEVK